MGINSANNRLSLSSSSNSFGEAFKKTAKNIAIGSLIIAGGIWALFNLPVNNLATPAQATV